MWSAWCPAGNALKAIIETCFPITAVLRKAEKHGIRLQIDGTKLTNEINVINFAGLFSDTATGISRSVDARLQFEF
jgi:hypothetical protein